ncbi:hypothetical protein BSL78_07671 [Apostichopus japonicus]|uniref:Uncharacterized protein n=1 Tax=Stichopus japonicus TaxID=307972 RepID=A0A2G8L5A6_STIJA|nr:hypothetical protein BSL78_07671 [Apostichopus japonicus]
MASNFEQHMVKPASGTGFGSFKAELADILTEDIISQLAIYFNYPPVKYDLLKKDVGRNYLMVQYMEERGEIREIDITTLLRALEARKLHGTQKRVQTMFELHTGKRCTGDDQSMQQPEHQTGNMDLGLKGSLTSDLGGPTKHNPGKWRSSTCIVHLRGTTNTNKEGERIYPGASTRIIILWNTMPTAKSLVIHGLFATSVISSESLSSIPRLLSIEVQWRPSEPGFHLDCIRGKWISNSKEATTLEGP